MKCNVLQHAADFKKRDPKAEFHQRKEVALHRRFSRVASFYDIQFCV
jgi:hypothetical protein